MTKSPGDMKFARSKHAIERHEYTRLIHHACWLQIEPLLTILQAVTSSQI